MVEAFPDSKGFSLQVITCGLKKQSRVAAVASSALAFPCLFCDDIALVVLLVLLEPGIKERTWTEPRLAFYFFFPVGISVYLLVITAKIYLCFLISVKTEPNIKLFLFSGLWLKTSDVLFHHSPDIQVCS